MELRDSSLAPKCSSEGIPGHQAAAPSLGSQSPDRPSQPLAKLPAIAGQAPRPAGLPGGGKAPVGSRGEPLPRGAGEGGCAHWPGGVGSHCTSAPRQARKRRLPTPAPVAGQGARGDRSLARPSPARGGVGWGGGRRSPLPAQGGGSLAPEAPLLAGATRPRACLGHPRGAGCSLAADRRPAHAPPERSPPPRDASGAAELPLFPQLRLFPQPSSPNSARGLLLLAFGGGGRTGPPEGATPGPASRAQASPWGPAPHPGPPQVAAPRLPRDPAGLVPGPERQRTLPSVGVRVERRTQQDPAPAAPPPFWEQEQGEQQK
uniref:collagen alpha-1(I) chain-like n=1 Tax=Euleptes europaea TaxID=460621 RepID=UPI00254264E9|nr:collagen alpha-1(I) chain-like [Euleptes europaea]